MVPATLRRKRHLEQPHAEPLLHPAHPVSLDVHVGQVAPVQRAEALRGGVAKDASAHARQVLAGLLVQVDVPAKVLHRVGLAQTVHKAERKGKEIQSKFSVRYKGNLSKQKNNYFL